MEPASSIATTASTQGFASLGSDELGSTSNRDDSPTYRVLGRDGAVQGAARPDVPGAVGVFLPLVDWFGDDDVAQLFSEESLVDAWLAVERALASAQAELGVIPPEAAAAIEAVAVPENVDLGRLRSRTLVVGYPILPLARADRRALPRGSPLRPLGRDHAGHHGHRPRAARSSRARSNRRARARTRRGDRGQGRRAPRDRDAGPHPCPTRRPDHLRREAGRLARRADPPSRAAPRCPHAPRGRAAVRRRRHGCCARTPEPRSPPWRGREAGARGGRRPVAHRPRLRGRGGARARGDGGHLRQARQRGDRALPPGDRRGARGGGPSARARPRPCRRRPTRSAARRSSA